jgi:hypothetical protein
VALVVAVGGAGVALVVAVAGVVLALASLGWQAVAWWYNGARIRVSLTSEVRSPTGTYPHGMHLVLRVRNVGRSPAQVTGYGFLIADWIVREQRPAPTLPHTLDGSHEVTWYQRCAGLPFDDRPTATTTSFRAFVDLGNGRQRRSEAVSVPNVAINRAPAPGDQPAMLAIQGKPIQVAAGSFGILQPPRTYKEESGDGGAETTTP